MKVVEDVDKLQHGGGCGAGGKEEIMTPEHEGGISAEGLGGMWW